MKKHSSRKLEYYKSGMQNIQDKLTLVFMCLLPLTNKKANLVQIKKLNDVMFLWTLSLPVKRERDSRGPAAVMPHQPLDPHIFAHEIAPPFADDVFGQNG